LISDLRPPMMIPSPFVYVLERLAHVQGIEAERGRLQQVADRLALYDALPIGEGERAFRELVEYMKEVAEVQHPVQVDLALGKQQMKLNRAVGEEAARAAEVLWRLSPGRAGAARLFHFKDQFLERYGYDREVPLLELLDEDQGIGSPRAYNDESLLPTELYDEKRNSLLLQLVNRTINRKQMEIELTDELIDALEPVAMDRVKAPLSLELYFSVIAASQQAVDRDEFRLVIGGNPESGGAGQTFGRFVDLMGEEVERQL
jgi:hypothetical protein